MADDVTLDAGAGGDTIAADDIAGVKHPRVKVQYGVDGAATDVSDTNPLPVDDAGGSLTVDNATISVVGSGVEATAQRVTIATDSTGVLSVDDNGGSLTVDDGAGSLTVDNATISVVGGGAEATAQRVTIANDSTGVLSIDDNGGSLTVDGTVTVQDGGGAITVDGTVTADTELPAAAALADNTANPTVPGVGAFALIWDGATWDRATQPLTDTQLRASAVPVSNSVLSVVGGGTEATAQRVTIANDSTGVLSVDDNGSTLSIDDGAGSLTVDNAALSVVGGGAEATAVRVTVASDSTGVLSVDDNGGSLTVDGTVALSAGSALIGGVNVRPATTGGLTIFRTLDLDETEEEIKATAGQVFGWFIYNDASSEVYVKLYNATAANVTVGATTPVITIPIPASSAANVEFTNGIAFGTAITAAATTGVADADTAAPAANQVVANIFYA